MQSYWNLSYIYLVYTNTVDSIEGALYLAT